MKLTLSRCCSEVGLPEISKRCSHPFSGGVALVEMPAETTSGIAAILCRSWSK